jgi:organic radical activating enzyme
MSIFAKSKTLALMLTYACPAECRNCGTSSSPVDKNRLNLQAALSGIEQAKALDFSNVVFTGGESTLRWQDLLEGIRHANRRDLPTRLVTNAHWATSVARASDLVGELIDCGLDEINFSTGDEHVRFIPLERVVFATMAAVKHGLQVHVMVEMTGERKISKNDIFMHPLIEQLADNERGRITATESPWMPLDPQQIEKYPEGVATDGSNVVRSTGCDSVLQTYVLQADGRIGSCCGLGMRHVAELNVGVAKGSTFLADAVREAEEDFLKIWLRNRGPEKILAWAATFDPEIGWEGKYGHCCQACMRVYQDPRVHKVIKEHYHEVMGEVLQLAWLNEQFIPEKLFSGADRVTATSP